MNKNITCHLCISLLISLLMGCQTASSSITNQTNTQAVSSSATGNNANTENNSFINSSNSSKDIHIGFAIAYPQNSSNLDTQYHQVLDLIANKMIEDDTALIMLNGHISTAENNSNNFALAKNRVEMIESYMVIKHNVDSSRIKRYDCGDSVPMATAQPESVEINSQRRVDFLVTNLDSYIEGYEENVSESCTSF